ncbi:MAG: hypothetical protein ABIO05_10035 [Ferruginibacter sp.]
MKRNTSIQLRAAFLLMVFALNTLVGFACAAGVDMGFNTKHHEEDKSLGAAVHVHKDGKKHLHEVKKESHQQNKSHHQEEANNEHKSGSIPDNCCNDKVINFQQSDKSVPNSLSILHPVFFTSFITSYFNINSTPYKNVATNKKRFVRGHHPPIPDIRIAIQSFLI